MSHLLTRRDVTNSFSTARTFLMPKGKEVSAASRWIAGPLNQSLLCLLHSPRRLH